MTRRLTIGLATLALALPAAALGMDMADESSDSAAAHVSVLFGAVTPTRVDVLAGESVAWSNDSVRNHTVSADDGSYDSGNLAPSSHYSRMFDSVGAYAYHCRLHPYIRGEVDVHRLLLNRPTDPAGAGRPYPLAGRAALPAGTAVAIESDLADGRGWTHVTDTTVGVDGHFSVQVEPKGSGSYRAVSGEDTSPPVDLLVLDRSVSASVRGGRITVGVSPASPGATVVLQLYLKEHFGWWPTVTRRLDKSSRASFRVATHRRVSARVLLTLPDGATPLAKSKLLKLNAH